MDADPDPAAPTLRLAPGVDVDALEQALLRARATELSEVRRRQVRLSAGYGDATTRGSVTVVQKASHPIDAARIGSVASGIITMRLR